MRYAFWVHRDSGRDFVHRSDDPAPLATLESLVDGELYDEPDQPGLWATLDRQTTVERFSWINVGSLPEDHLGSGVPVVAS